MPLGQGASARLGLGAEASYQVAPGLEMRGSFRAGNMGQSGLTMSAGATYKPSDWAAISVDGSCKIVGGGVRDLGVKVVPDSVLRCSPGPPLRRGGDSRRGCGR